jgi:CRP-like cAMP-binding protein
MARNIKVDMEPIRLLSQNPIFAHLNDDSQQALAKEAVSRHYHTGEWIAHNGENWPYLFLVSEGSITAVKESSEGRSLIIETVRSGEILWGIAFFEPQAPMPVALVSAEDSQLYLWSRSQLLPILMENGPAVWELSRLVIGRVQRASNIVEELAFQPVAGRLARFLVDHFGEIPGGSVKREMTLDEMAAHIGTTREVVCRILQRFSNQGLIDITRTEFTFTDRERLAQLAQNEHMKSGV